MLVFVIILNTYFKALTYLDTKNYTSIQLDYLFYVLIFFLTNLSSDVVELTGAKDNWDRADRLRYWKRKGGALVIGYDMYRNLTNETTKKFKGAQKKVFQETLVDPGPDLVVCKYNYFILRIPDLTKKVSQYGKCEGLLGPKGLSILRRKSHLWSPHQYPFGLCSFPQLPYRQADKKFLISQGDIN